MLKNKQKKMCDVIEVFWLRKISVRACFDKKKLATNYVFVVISKTLEGL